MHFYLVIWINRIQEISDKNQLIYEAPAALPASHKKRNSNENVRHGHVMTYRLKLNEEEKNLHFLKSAVHLICISVWCGREEKPGETHGHEGCISDQQEILIMMCY